MPFNGSGSYSAPVNSWNPAVSQSIIDPQDWNATQSDYETGLSTMICRDGQSTLTNNIPFSGFKATGVNTNSGSTSRSEFASGATMQDGAPLDAGYTGGTDTAYTATLTPAIAAYADKQCFRVIFDQACGATPTINFNTVGAKKIYWNNAGSTTQITTNDIPINYPATLRYDSTLDGSAGAFWLMNPVQSVGAGDITPLQLAASAVSAPVNLGFTASVAANALTIAVKGEDGNDPSATNVVKIPFSDQSGNYDVLSITAATSLVVSSGSTLGTLNATAGRLWIVGFNDSGTFRLGIINTQTSTGIFALAPYNTASSTAEGGAGAADSAGVFYTGTAVTTKPYIILGFIESTQATAGTWATAPSKAVIWRTGMMLPGHIFNTQLATLTTHDSTSTTIPNDDSIPQSGEGKEALTGSITLTSGINYYEVIVNGFASNSIASGNAIALFRDAGADAINAIAFSVTSANVLVPFSLYWTASGATAGATTFKVRFGPNTGTMYLNGTSGSRYFGGVGRLVLAMREIMA